MKFSIPSWIWPWGVCALLVLALAGQQIRVSGLQVDLARERQAVSAEEARRTSAALAFQQLLDRVAAAHAVQQQESEDAFNEKLKTLQRDRDRRADDNQRLREQIATFTADDRRPGESDAAALQRATDRLQLVGRLLAEGAELVNDGIGIVERRDLEVGRLLEQIRTDRAACAPVSRWQ